MNVIAVVAQKGGVGKTTLTQCLAVEALRQGMAAAIIDTDPQRSAGEWGSQREQAGIDAPAVLPLGSRPLRSVIKDLENQGAASHASSSNNAFASLRSAVSNPSVNQW